MPNGDQQPIIEARAVEKWFELPGEGGAGGTGPRIQAVAPTTFSISSDSFVALLGPSGSGKSTLLRMLAGLIAPSAGEILWHGRPLRLAAAPTTGGARSAIVFQNYALFPWLTVLQNVEVALEALSREPGERHQRAMQMLDLVGLDGFETAYPKELSGGMKQRVGLARALAVEPEVLFMDEPFSALDVLTAESLRGELLELWLDHKMPTKAIFLITHNIEEAVLLADRVLVLSHAPGHIRADVALHLPHPRQRKAPRLTQYLDYFYACLTQPAAAVPPPPRARGAPRRFRPLPHATPGALSGLVEQLAGRGGREDLHRLAHELSMELSDLLSTLEAAALLHWVRIRGADAELTPEGASFAEAGIQPRKQMFRLAVLRRVPQLRLIHAALRRRRGHSLSDQEVRSLLRRHGIRADLTRQVETLIGWGRYAELFDYHAARGRLQAPEGAEQDRVP